MDFLEGRTVDHPPFHPILMRFAAKYSGVNYRDFCLNYADKCSTNLQCAADFSYDWVNVMSDPYAEAVSFGTRINYPLNSLPVVEALLVNDIQDVDHLVGSIENFLPLLSANQVFSGNSDPVSVIQNGTHAQVEASFQSCDVTTQGRGIVSAGCEITPETTVERL
jgi:uroporphyrinogen-III decarboxylase